VNNLRLHRPHRWTEPPAMQLQPRLLFQRQSEQSVELQKRSTALVSTNDTFYDVEYSSMTYKFRKFCNMQAVINGGHATCVNQATSTLNDCINICAAYNKNNVTKSTGKDVCSSVCWRNGFNNDDWPGQCFGYAGKNDSYSESFNLQADVTCDSAIWINEA
jgi:hypothetical protein